MNHTQNILLDRVKEIRNLEADYLTWNGPDPRGKDKRKIMLEWANELEEIVNMKEETKNER